MYSPQIDDLTHVLNDVTGFAALAESGTFGDLSGDLVDAILAEAGRFASEVLAPINRPGDLEGCSLDTDTYAVSTASGWKEAYRQWCEAGWAALPCEEEYGGQGLPICIGLAVQEMWNSAASAFGIGTLLTQGAVEAISAHGSDALKQKYLPSMVAGTWMGTMNLTEPQAGSDLAALKAKAVPQGDGTYRITGTKIFITHGEHDLTSNIIHLVLARLPDAPAGTRGISLFLVPKFHVNDDGSLGERNDVKCVGLEEKLGIHGSPTCVMQFGDGGGAVGWLVGEENKGLNCMFTMMNNARLHVGMQGVAIAERATQLAVAYAGERKQGRQRGVDGMVEIIAHADVRRMLMDMKSKTAAARAMCYETALALDLAQRGGDDEIRTANGNVGALLTPVAKAFGTDIGVEVASLGIQVHGGMGFIEETGAAQHLRDARITPIYEGTNGIQAIDLVGRKLPLEGGETVKGYLERIATLCGGLEAAGLGGLAGALSAALEDLGGATAHLGGLLKAGDDAALATATPYLRLFGLTAGAAGLMRGALAASRRNDRGAADQLRMQLAHYFAANHLPHTGALRTIVTGGAHSLAAATPELIAGA